MEEKHDNEAQEINWKVPEFEKHQRSKNWYIVAGFVAAFLLIFAVFVGNYLFSIIIVITALITIFHDGKSPDLVKVKINPEGVTIGRKSYEYDILKDFAIVFRPKEEINNLYFEFKNPARQRLSIPLEDQDPLAIRSFLLQYLEEDLDRTNIPLSENLSKFLKI